MPEVEEFRFLKKYRALADSSGKISSPGALPHAECDSRVYSFSPICSPTFAIRGFWKRNLLN